MGAANPPPSNGRLARKWGGSFYYAATTSPAGCNRPGFLSDTESEPSMKRVTMRQKTMFMFYIENEDFDIAFIPKSKEAEKTIRAKADANRQSLAEYFQNTALADLASAELTD
jgi:hypothetical protein